MSRRHPIPYDKGDEAALLGAALITREAAELVARHTNPSDFHVPAHQRIRAAIVDLIDHGEPVDAATVANHFARHNGVADPAVAKRQLAEVVNACPIAANAPTYLRNVRDWGRRRRMIVVAGQLTNAAHDDGKVDGVRAQLEGLEHEEHLDTSCWRPADRVALLAALDGHHMDTEPEVLVRNDGVCLLYTGKVHLFAGEPESGKSWLLLHACAEQIGAGNHVAYIDFEDDLVSVLARLVALGVTPDRLVEQFHYVRPITPLTMGDWGTIAELIVTHRPSLVVIDGLTEALTLHHLEINSNRDVATFFALLPRPVARMGPAVAIIDHVAKNPDQRGRWAIGAQHKLAAVDGASYILDVIKPVIRDRDGLVKISVAKDRPGHVRRASAGKTVAEMRSHSDHDQIHIELVAASGSGPDDEPGSFRPTTLMERVSRWLELNPDASGREVRDAIPGKTTYVVRALEILIAEEHISTTSGARGAILHRVTKPFRATPDEHEHEAEK